MISSLRANDCFLTYVVALLYTGNNQLTISKVWTCKFSTDQLDLIISPSVCGVLPQKAGLGSNHISYI